MVDDHNFLRDHTLKAAEIFTQQRHHATPPTDHQHGKKHHILRPRLNGLPPGARVSRAK